MRWTTWSSPTAPSAAGTLKPEVVFFGEFVPTEKFAEAAALVRQADAMVIAGSSLVVNSGIRLLDQAVEAPHARRDRQPRRDQGRPARDP